MKKKKIILSEKAVLLRMADVALYWMEESHRFEIKAGEIVTGTNPSRAQLIKGVRNGTVRITDQMKKLQLQKRKKG